MCTGDDNDSTPDPHWPEILMLDNSTISCTHGLGWLKTDLLGVLAVLLYLHLASAGYGFKVKVRCQSWARPRDNNECRAALQVPVTLASAAATSRSTGETGGHGSNLLQHSSRAVDHTSAGVDHCIDSLYQAVNKALTDADTSEATT